MRAEAKTQDGNTEERHPKRELGDQTVPEHFWSFPWCSTGREGCCESHCTAQMKPSSRLQEGSWRAVCLRAGETGHPGAPRPPRASPAGALTAWPQLPRQLLIYSHLSPHPQRGVRTLPQTEATPTCLWVQMHPSRLCQTMKETCQIWREASSRQPHEFGFS